MLPKTSRYSEKRKNSPLINGDDIDLKKTKVLADEHGLPRIRKMNVKLPKKSRCAKPDSMISMAQNKHQFWFLIRENQCNPCYQRYGFCFL
jgi:hypothetical protein